MQEYRKKFLGSGNNNTILVISNDEIVESLEDCLLSEGVSETIQNEAGEQRGGFLSMLFGTLGASLLGNILTGKGINRAGEGVLRACYGNNGNNKMVIPPHALTNLETQKYYKNEPRFNGVYSRDNLSKMKDGTYIINLDEYSDIGTHLVALWVNNNVTYFDSFGVEHIPKEIIKFIENKNIKTNIFRIQAYV